MQLSSSDPIAPPPITAVIDIGEFLEAKIAAFQAHSSQAPLFPIFEKTVRQRGAEESFHLAAAREPRRLEFETDLFTGVLEDKPSGLRPEEITVDRGYF